MGRDGRDEEEPGSPPRPPTPEWHAAAELIRRQHLREEHPTPVSRPLLPSRKNHSAHYLFSFSSFLALLLDAAEKCTTQTTHKRLRDAAIGERKPCQTPTNLQNHRAAVVKKYYRHLRQNGAACAFVYSFFLSSHTILVLTSEKTHLYTNVVFDFLFNFIFSHSPSLLTHTTFTHDEKTKLSPKLRHKKRKKKRCSSDVRIAKPNHP